MNFKKLRNECQDIWDEKVGIRDIVKAAYDVYNRPSLKYSHSNPIKAVESKFDKNVSSRRGNYCEKVVHTIVANDNRFELLKECVSENGKQSKCGNEIDSPLMLLQEVDAVIAKASSTDKKVNMKDMSEMSGIMDHLYLKAIEMTKYNIPESDMVHLVQDLDIGFKVKETEDIYLYEVKYTGSFGGDVAWEHLRKYLRAYVDYVYKNKPSRDKIHTAMLLTRRDNPDSFRYLPRGENGFITFEDFCLEHDINISKKQMDELFFDITQINDDEVTEILDMFTILIQKDEELLKRPFADVVKAFSNEFSMDI